jgi:hypothetical protein
MVTTWKKRSAEINFHLTQRNEKPVKCAPLKSVSLIRLFCRAGPEIMSLNWGGNPPPPTHTCMHTYIHTHIYSHMQNVFLSDTGLVAKLPQPSFHSETEIYGLPLFRFLVTFQFKEWSLRDSTAVNNRAFFNVNYRPDIQNTVITNNHFQHFSTPI